MKIQTLFTLLLLTGLLSTCKTNTPMTTATHYNYADGSGNYYTLKPTSLQYDPVKPAESSSGTYSGGEAKTVKISEAQYLEIEALIQAGISSKSAQIEHRVMGSGYIKVHSDKLATYILNPKSPERAKIEEALKKALE